ncbi:MAG: hypothetical protein FD167_4767, partial [bacterium]
EEVPAQHRRTIYYTLKLPWRYVTRQFCYAKRIVFRSTTLKMYTHPRSLRVEHSNIIFDDGVGF